MNGMSTRELERATFAELLGEIKSMRAAQSEYFTERKAQGRYLLNHVVDHGTALFDANGMVKRDYGGVVASLFVANTSDTSVTVYAGPPGPAGAPTTGTGVHLIPGGTSAVVPIGAQSFTLYGTAGRSCTYAAYSRAQPPSTGTALQPGTNSQAAVVSGTVTIGSQPVPLRQGTPLLATATANPGASTSATLAAAAGQTTYVTGWSLSWDGSAAAATNDTVTVGGPSTALTYAWASATGVGGALGQQYAAPIPASAQNTAISLSVPATASRATARLVIEGFRL